jgi:hypothetical protein
MGRRKAGPNFQILPNDRIRKRKEFQQENMKGMKNMNHFMLLIGLMFFGEIQADFASGADRGGRFPRPKRNVGRNGLRTMEGRSCAKWNFAGRMSVPKCNLGTRGRAELILRQPSDFASLAQDDGICGSDLNA